MYRLFFQEGQNRVTPRHTIFPREDIHTKALRHRIGGGGQAVLVSKSKVQRRQRHLFEAIRTLSSTGSFPRCLDSWQKNSDEDANDGDHDQQLHHGKAST